MSITMLLKSSHGKYLTAVDDTLSVTQDRNKSPRAEWTVEFVPDANYIRLKSCYGKYLTATDDPFLLGMTGFKVITMPGGFKTWHNWKPVIVENEGLKLKSSMDNFSTDTYLSANGGPPPWRNVVTHDVEGSSRCLWDVYVTDISDGSQSTIKTSARSQEDEADKYKYIKETLLRFTSVGPDVVSRYAPQIAAAMQNSAACTIL